MVAIASALLTWYWLLLRWWPRRVLRDARAGGGRPASAEGAPASSWMRVVVSAVDRAAELHPCRPQCLERALASRTLLTWLGEPATVAIGVGRSGHVIDAHAWVEVAETTIDATRPAFRTFIHLS